MGMFRSNKFWALCRQIRRPKPSYRYNRVGRRGRASRLAPVLHPPLRQQIHRNLTHRDRLPSPNHLRKRHAVHLGRAGREPLSNHLGGLSG
ncbi:hypothetical protein BDM02DRAFT_2310442 [Thelephora ganbajun]|uniref:Uncharacterized protein n=1 Tax=Thelephora ganbajun TaxID=370292 RepID=A0ACB6YYT9_THEGA|nr:hypothetical protein BDM02DRAFT_2310442 [Thelephora ganbajun]